MRDNFFIERDRPSLSPVKLRFERLEPSLSANQPSLMRDKLSWMRVDRNKGGDRPSLSRLKVSDGGHKGRFERLDGNEGGHKMSWMRADRFIGPDKHSSLGVKPRLERRSPFASANRPSGEAGRLASVSGRRPTSLSLPLPVAYCRRFVRPDAGPMR
jgi:hypothetical protein